MSLDHRIVRQVRSSPPATRGLNRLSASATTIGIPRVAGLFGAIAEAFARELSDLDHAETPPGGGDLTKALYSLPQHYLGARLQARADSELVKLYKTPARVADSWSRPTPASHRDAGAPTGRTQRLL